MLSKILFGLIFTILISCGQRFPNGQKCFKRTKVLLSSYSSHKLWDEYFKLRRGGFFDYYKRMLGLNKMALYTGTYKVKSDTLFLNFCNETIPENLTGLGVIDSQGQIILFKKDTTFNSHFIITIDNRTKDKRE